MAEKRTFLRSKKFLVFTAVAAIIVIVGLIFWNQFKYKFVGKKVDELVTGKSKGLYQVNYQNLFIDEALGNLSVDSLEMVPDTAMYKTLDDQKKAPPTLFFIHIPKLLVSGVKTPKALLNKEISAGVIRIQNPSIKIWTRKHKAEKENGFFKKMGPELFRQILGNLKSMHADSVVIENASVELTDQPSGQEKVILKGLSFRFARIDIDSLAPLDSTRILFSRELTVHCNSINMPAGNKMYTLEVADFDFNSQTGKLHTGLFQMKPRLSETAFVKSYKYAIDRMDIRIGSIDILQLDRTAYLDDKLIASAIEINSASFHVFRDKSFPHDSVDRTHDFPQEALMRLPVDIDIKKIKIRDSYVEYKEKNEKSDSSGKVSFFHVQAELDNVTNIRGSIRRNQMMTLNYRADFLNQSKFTAVIRMRLDDRQGHFTMDATMAPMNVTALNPLLKPMALAELKKGKITGLRYHLEASNTQAKGKLIFTYDGIAIKLLKKDNDKNKYKTKFLPTLAAGILLKESNPSGGETRIGNVEYERDIHRSIFNLMWKSMFSGIKQVAL